MADTTTTTINAQQYAEYWQQFDFCQAPEQHYRQQADFKKTYWLGFFHQHLSCDQDVLEKAPFFDSTPKHYRARIEFAARFLKNDSSDLSYVMFRPGSKQIIKINQCQQATTSISEAMPKLMLEINQTPELTQGCQQINFRSNFQGQLLITLIYRQSIADKSSSFQQHLHRLHQLYQWEIIARSHKKQWSCAQSHLDDQVIIGEKNYYYRQDDNTFTQPNPTINQQMIGWIKRQCAQSNSNDDLLELYCGNGNFSIALSDQFNRIMATEVVRESLGLANYAKQKNNIENIEFVRLSAHETAQAFSQERTFNRLKHIELNNYQFSTVLVDPPRCGIDSDTLKFLQGFRRIIYVSCNPITLVENFALLSSTHRIQSIALFDQFPYTHHVESIMILEKN